MYRQRLSCISVLLLLILASSCQNPGGGDQFWWQPDQYRVIDGAWIYLPQSYDPERTYPTIVFLQGGDLAAGPNNRGVKDYGPASVAQRPGTDRVHQFARDSFIVINPHMTIGPRTRRQWYHNSQELIQMVEDIGQAYSVDRRRIYLTGGSKGGHGSFGVAKDAPGFFAAIVPIAGRINCNSGCENLKALPMWIVHREGDHMVEVDYAESVVAHFSAELGLDFLPAPSLALSSDALQQPRLLTILPGEGHSGWDEVYQSASFYEWLLNFSLENVERE